MINSRGGQLRPILAETVLWIIHLRWIAGAVIVLLSLIQHWIGPWYDHWIGMVFAGLGVLAMNVIFAFAHDRLDWKNASSARVALFAWGQLIFDLAILTLLASWTGGPRSPLLGFYVLHMIFASLILKRSQAYAIALVSIMMFTAGLSLSQTWPDEFVEWMFAGGWVTTLLISVHLANHLSSRLFRREQGRLMHRRRARSLKRQLETQQQALLQHEKLVAMGQLTAGVAHEISNPLASMDALLQVLQRKPERMNAESLTSLREQIRRIQETVMTLTGLAHPDLGERQRVNLNEITETTMKTLRFDRRIRSIDVQLELATDLPPVNAVLRAIVQVLMNLVMNAVDAMTEQEAPVLRLRTRRTDDEILIDVIDNGHGIPSDQLERIFRPFVTTKPVGKGTGLGLSISRALMRDHGGDLTVVSNLGSATVFTVHIPISGMNNTQTSARHIHSTEEVI